MKNDFCPNLKNMFAKSLLMSQFWIIRVASLSFLESDNVTVNNLLFVQIFAWDPCWAFVKFLRTICRMGVFGLTRNFPPLRLVFVKNSSSSAAAFRFAHVWASSFPKIPKQFEGSLSLRGVTFRERKALINFAEIDKIIFISKLLNLINRLWIWIL